MRFWLALAVFALASLLTWGAGAQAPVWYWCEAPHGYYPWVRSCPVGWRPVNPPTVMPQPYALPPTAAGSTPPQPSGAYPGALAPGNAGPEWDRLHPAEAQRREEDATAAQRRAELANITPSQRQEAADDDAALAELQAVQRWLTNHPNCAECASDYQLAVARYDAEISGAQQRAIHRLYCEAGQARPGSCP